MELELDILERMNLQVVIKIASSSFQERKVLDNFVKNVEFSTAEIERADIYKDGENTFNRRKNFVKKIELLDIDVKTLKRVVLDFAEQVQCVNDANKSLFYKIDALEIKQ